MKGTKVMRKVITSLIALFFIALPSIGMSLSGQKLKEMCTTEDAGSTEYSNCVFYIIGAREGLIWGSRISAYRTRDEGQSTTDVVSEANLNLGVCIPDNTEAIAVIDRILNYIKIVDTSDNKGATLLIYNAMKLAFPCE